MDRLVGKELRSLSNMIRRQLDNSSAVREIENMTGTHGWAIGYLFDNRERDVFQRDIEEEFHIRRSSATKLLQLMEKNGLITREAVDYDARLKKIVLTEKALSLHEKLKNAAVSVEEKFVRGIPDEQLSIFFETLDTIKNNIENEVGKK